MTQRQPIPPPEARKHLRHVLLIGDQQCVCYWVNGSWFAPDGGPPVIDLQEASYGRPLISLEMTLQWMDERLRRLEEKLL